MSRVIRRHVAIDPRSVAHSFRDEKNANDHGKSSCQNRTSHLRRLALRMVHRILQSVLDHHIRHGSSLSVSLRGGEHRYGRFLSIHGRSE